MGQYYIAVILSNNGKTIRRWMHPHKYNNGAKLMEHSYIGNNFVEAFEHLISPEGMYYKSCIVWQGDYADLNTTDDESDNLAVDNNDNEILPCPESQNKSSYRYIVNHSKKLYVDKERCLENKNNIHPLPLLVSEGNGRGGGDYRGHNIELCGTWSRNLISVENSINNGYTELECNFQE